MAEHLTKEKCARCDGRGSIPPAWPVGPGGASLGDYKCSACDGTGRIATTEAVASVTRIPAPDVADKGASSTPTLMSGGDLDQPLLHGMESTAASTSVRPGEGVPSPGGRATLSSNEELSTYRDFWRKHALGPLARPSCLVCGHVPTEWPPGIQHGELPGIVVCTRCRDAGQRAAHETTAPSEALKTMRDMLHIAQRSGSLVTLTAENCKEVIRELERVRPEETSALTSCQHDLLLPNDTIMVDEDGRGGTCCVCRKSWSFRRQVKASNGAR